MNTSTSSDNKKESQANIFSDDSENYLKKFKWHQKKKYYLYLNNFYKCSLHTTDLRFQLQFTE